MIEEKTVIQHIKNWIEQVVIKHDFCPFAAKAFIQKSIYFVVEDGKEEAICLEEFMMMALALDRQPKIETAFIIFSNAFEKFEDYLDFFDLAQHVLTDQEYDGIYQIASFHPNYQFEGSSIDDAANFTNRSPYPMLQLIREESIEKVLETYDNPESIPQRNIELTRSFGIEKMKKMLKKCFTKL